MKQMIISTYSYRLQIEEYINKRLEELKLRDYKPSINVDEKGKTIFVICSSCVEIPEAKAERYFKEYIIMPVAKAMVDMIQKEFAIDYANEVLQTSYGFREIVITDMMEDTIAKNKLLDPIITEMTEKDTFCLDGWIRFRLSEYKLYMIDIVENLTYEYEVYKEYEEFITLIKYFVLSQESLIEQIHIIPSNNGDIHIYNEEIEPLDFDTEQYDSEDDLILGTLITLAPLRMIIHQKEKCKNMKLIETIKAIYENRVTFCNGCKDCEISRFKIGFIRALKDILTQKKL